MVRVQYIVCQGIDDAEIRRRCSILRSRTRLVSVISFIAILFVTTASPVFARPTEGSKQAEYQRVQAQINRIDQQLDVVVEEYNTSMNALTKTRRELQSCAAALRTAEKESAKRQALINRRLKSIYKEGGISYLEVLISTKSLDEFLYLLGYVERLTERDAQIVAELKESKKEITAQRVALLEKEKKQGVIIAEIKSKKQKIASQLKEKKGLFARISDEISRQRAIEQRRQAKLRNQYKVSYKVRPSTLVSRGEGRSGIVDFAMAEIGKPYVWGADGPGSFDCSGLTQYVYGKSGVFLPHSSRAQYGSGQHVSRDELQAGDLVFFSRGGTISHVGIYIGGDNFIHAPSTGDVVKISSIGGHGGYVGAVRP